MLTLTSPLFTICIAADGYQHSEHLLRVQQQVLDGAQSSDFPAELAVLSRVREQASGLGSA